MWFRIYNLAIIIIVGITCNSTQANPMVGVNIQTVADGEFTYTVSVKRITITDEQEDDHLCSGVLVSKKDVLTTAHIFNDLSVRDMVVLVGSNDLRNSKKIYPYMSLTFDRWSQLYNQPNETKMNDIAMIRLTRSISDTILPAMISEKPVATLYGLHVVIAAWGMTQEGKISRFMRSAVLKVLSNSYCEHRIKLLRGLDASIPENMICTVGLPYTVMTNGDSGGGVFHNGRLVAIHQGTCLYPDEPLNPNKINLHVAVEPYMKFIEHFQTIHSQMNTLIKL